MRSYDFSVSSASWVLVYDSAELGDFYGYAQVTNSADIMLRIGTELPAASDSGALLRGFPRLVTVKASAYENIYARARGNRGLLSLMAVSDMQLPSSLGQKTAAGSLSTVPASDAVHIVAGQSAVGSVPVNPPVGVAAVDRDGKKRAIRSDADGRLNVITPDCADVSGSVSSADVLFSVDMLNYQSITVNITSAGSSCTIVYEQSSDGSTNWVPIAGTNQSMSTTSGGPASQSTAAAVLSFPKRYRWFRARVSVYGSGTVSALGSLTSSLITPAVGAVCWGVTNEGFAASGAPVAIAAEARTSSKTSVTSGQVVRPIATVDGRLIMRPHSIPENEWAYAPPSGGLVNSTTAVVIKAAAGGSIRNYITSVQVMAEALTNATELTVENGDGTVLWRTKIPTTGLPTVPIRFDDPIKGTANASLQIRTVTASGTGAVYCNVQGYTAP